MEPGTLKILTLVAPLFLAIVLMSSGNYQDSGKPILSYQKFIIYRTIALSLGLFGLFGAFGAFNFLVEDFDRFWGSYLFSAIFLNFYLDKVRDMHVQKNHNSGVSTGTRGRQL